MTQDTDPHELSGYCESCEHCTGRTRPLPHDHRAERRVAFAMVEHVSWKSLEPMLSDWFYSDVPRMIVKSIAEIQRDGPAKSIAHVVDVLHDQGFRGPLETEVEFLCHSTPFYGLDSVREDLARIKELWRTRRAIQWLETYVVEMRSGTRTAGQVLESIERLKGEI